MATNPQVENLKSRMTPENWKKLEAIPNPSVIEFIAKYAEHCNPSSVYVCDGSERDVQYIRDVALRNGEEKKLKTSGHSIHFDSEKDCARAKGDTKILVKPGVKLGGDLNTMDREAGLAEVHGILKGIMTGREMYVYFGCLAPNNGIFSIPVLQVSDSSYVVHNEMLLFRSGYQDFLKLSPSGKFFRFVHSQGELEGGVSKNLNQRRIYMDTSLEGMTVYSTNNQYGGNSLGFKKHAMRLAIAQAHRDGNWLCEHMFIMGVHGPGGRKTYFSGAYPSACGKTSTAMVEGETIVGDDIAYLRVVDGVLRIANVERGMFGIIGGVNSNGDPEIFKALTSPGEVIFSNVLVDGSNEARWNGDGRPAPEGGVNYAGQWTPAKVNAEGKPAPMSHPNARFTIAISTLKNRDPSADDPKGVPLGGVIYGGRDSDTCVPVEQAFDWAHGILTKAVVQESETTFATTGAEGKRDHSPMSNGDFLSISLPDYLADDLKIVQGVKSPPLIFSTNYFLRKDGNPKGEFLTGIDDKRVWLKWMELRVHGDVDAIRTPTGFIPRYEDLRRMFREVLGKDYTQAQYDEQFTIRTPQLLAKIERMNKIFGAIEGTPPVLFQALEEQKQRILQAQNKHGDFIKPEQLL